MLAQISVTDAVCALVPGEGVLDRIVEPYALQKVARRFDFLSDYSQHAADTPLHSS
ncbi:hypothetical protein FIV09_14115 [Roseivivax sp. THAF197b]|nr:hypothetical protein FIV09_14115 [Roseivivax sp. THAF197b]